eukprot:5549358-Amphidinium_carterae.1
MPFSSPLRDKSSEIVAKQHLHLARKGRPIIYKWGRHQLSDDTWADNVFTYLKRCSLVTKLGDREVSLENIIRGLRELDDGHFQRLLESLHIESV